MKSGTTVINTPHIDSPFKQAQDHAHIAAAIAQRASAIRRGEMAGT